MIVLLMLLDLFLQISPGALFDVVVICNMSVNDKRRKKSNFNIKKKRRENKRARSFIFFNKNLFLALVPFL